jgi:nitrogen-specific signal transduction histidine kinase
MDMLEMSARMVGLAIERDRLEAQLREATKMEALGVLAGGVAHDFNNLLAAVIGNADLAMMSVGKESPVVHNLDQIVNASITATDLCKQMLAFTGQGVTTVEKFDLNNVVQQTGDMLRAAMPKKVNLSFNLSESSLGIKADKSQMRQVIMNLITNASESYGNGTGTISVGTEIHNYTKKELDLFHPDASLESGQYIRIWVTDSGVGMKPEVVAKIFDPFFSAKSGGRGLGLAAVKGILHAHRGAISVDSTPGEGTTFVIILPHIDLDTQEESFAMRTASHVTSRRILICEDDALVRDVLLTATKRAGYDVLEAADGQEAIDVFRSNADSIDCVLLDFNMPKLNGEEVFKELRKIREDARVVLCSGFTEHEILSRFEGSGIAGFIQKPVRIDALLTKINAVIQ